MKKQAWSEKDKKKIVSLIEKSAKKLMLEHWQFFPLFSDDDSGDSDACIIADETYKNARITFYPKLLINSM